MGVVCAFALPHPPLAVPAVGRGQELLVEKTVRGLQEAAGLLADRNPDAVVFATPHGTVYSDYFHISPGESARGDFSRFGAGGAAYETAYDSRLALEIGRAAGEMGLPAGHRGEREKALDHGVLVPLHYIRQKTRAPAVRVSMSGMDAAAHYMMGQAVARAAENLGRKIAVVASGDMSHKLSANGPYGLHGDGAEFDRLVTGILADADFSGLFSVPESLRANAGECGFGSFMLLAGCLDRLAVSVAAKSYEAPLGVGYGVAAYDVVGSDGSRNFLERHESGLKAEIEEARKTEGPYRGLARRALEHFVETGRPFPAGDAPEKLRGRRAGVFVSLHKHGRLRGCIGTIAPAAGTLAEEIIQNAVSAGTADERFMPVSARELPFLAYKVDVLDPPEDIGGPGQLDPAAYGVIVESGRKRGLLLPNLEGIGTAEEQIAVAKSKAGIGPGEKVRLRRFKVTRHE